MAWLFAAMATLSAGVPTKEPISAALTTINITDNGSFSANPLTTFAQRVSAETEPVYATPEIFQEADMTDFKDLPTNSRVMCDPVNWSEDQTTEDSPLAVDCLWLAYRLAAGDADWAIPGYVGGFRGIEHIGTCDIGCDAPNKAVRRAFVGNQDLINAIKHTMLKYSHVYPGDGWRRVAAKGSFRCSIGLFHNQVTVWWSIKRTKGS
ncbi:hypothetical protein GE09DRAFT_1223427 [Coniochaeta sp. 2T2.1]|nr:hypothetical protein GE09DRAFT_1223427 [Coniochaeta sp. 2T2.1]